VSLQRGKALKRTPMRSRQNDTGPDFETVMAVLDRDGFRCVRDGKPAQGQRGWDWSVQHRLPRSGGGGNGLDNLIILCGSGTTGCHGHVESHRTEAYDNGWLVRRGFDPATKPVLVDHQSRWVYLTPSGEYADNPPVVAA
jgi:hypothetical protein